MNILGSLALLMGGSLASGVNLYLTVACLGIAHRFDWIVLPGNLDVLAHPLVITVAVLLYAVEFFADKVPYVDSAWDSVHTFIRPFGGMMLGYMAMSDVAMPLQVAVALATGTMAMDSHLTKATSRMAINTSPEPVTNSVASVTEDAGVAGLIYLIIVHPVLAVLAAMIFLVFSVWFLWKMFHFLKKILKREQQPKTVTSSKKIQNDSFKE